MNDQTQSGSQTPYQTAIRLNPEHTILQIWSHSSTPTEDDTLNNRTSLQQGVNKTKPLRGKYLLLSSKSTPSTPLNQHLISKCRNKTFKISCRRPAAIIGRIRQLNSSYFPRKKQKISQKIAKLLGLDEYIPPPKSFVQYLGDYRKSRHWLQSWDVKQMYQKRADKLFGFLLLLILLFLLSKSMRQICFQIYSVVRTVM